MRLDVLPIVLVLALPNHAQSSDSPIERSIQRVEQGLLGCGFGGDLWLAKIRQQPTGIEDDSSSVADDLLRRNYPNRFNSQTLIRYSVPQRR